MTRDVDLVVLGRPVAVRFTRSDEVINTPLIDFVVDEVIRGDPIWSQPGIIEIYPDNTWEPITGTVVSAPTVMFLRNEAQRKQRFGETPDPGDEYVYYWPTVYQNVWVNFRNRVFIPMSPRIRRWLGSDTWPLPLKGEPFDDFVAQVRKAAGEPPPKDEATSGMRFAC